MAGTLNITVDQGSSWRRKIIMRSGTTDGPRVNLTGATIKAQVRREWNSALVKEIQVTPIDLAQGEFWLELDDTDRSLRELAFKWDLLVTLPGADPVKYLAGTVTVTPTITRNV